MIERRSFWHLVLLLGAILLAIEWGSRYLVVPWTVSGTSMQPTLNPGDRVLVDLWSLHRRAPRPGEVILFMGPTPDRPPLIKRVSPAPVSESAAAGSDGPAGVWVLGDNRERSLDSRRFGSVAPERVVGRVLFRYWPLEPGGLRLPVR